MGYNVSQEVKQAFLEKNAAEKAWNRKRIMKRIIKWLIIIGIIIAAVVFVVRSVKVSALQKTVAGKWDEISRLRIEEIVISDDGRFEFAMYDGQYNKGIYKIGPQCNGEAQRNASHGSLDAGEVCINFLNNGNEVVLIGIYNVEEDRLELYSSGSWVYVERINEAD